MYINENSLICVILDEDDENLKAFRLKYIDRFDLSQNHSGEWVTATYKDPHMVFTTSTACQNYKAGK